MLSLGRSYVGVLNRIIAAKPADLTLTMHICRGNFRSTWFSSGGYEPIAEILFANCPVDGFFLEYDSERSGGFEPLRFIKDQTVVLGLITSKFPELEDKEAVKARIAEAAKYVPLVQLCLWLLLDRGRQHHDRGGTVGQGPSRGRYRPRGLAGRVTDLPA